MGIFTTDLLANAAYLVASTALVFGSNNFALNESKIKELQ